MKCSQVRRASHLKGEADMRDYMLAAAVMALVLAGLFRAMRPAEKPSKVGCGCGACKPAREARDVKPRGD